MPRASKGPRLWLRTERRNKTGQLVSRAAFFILDQGKHIATGCTSSEIDEANLKLSEYISAKYRPARKYKDIEQIDVADVLSLYLDHKSPTVAGLQKLIYRLKRLNEYWGGRMLSEINGEECRNYALRRGFVGQSRRELQDLNAAIHYHNKEGLHRGHVAVTLPRKGLSRTRWLTRNEVARLLRVCLNEKAKNASKFGSRRPKRHLARFILMAVYTGTRSAAVLSASFEKGPGRSYVDLQAGIFYRMAQGKQETKKRQTPVPIPPRLLGHLKRWEKMSSASPDGDSRYIVACNGQSVERITQGFRKAVANAGLESDNGAVTPHTLRHTAATWLMQNGVDTWEAAGFLGMTVEMLVKVYGHHHPAYLKNAARSIGLKRPSP